MNYTNNVYTAFNQHDHTVVIQFNQEVPYNNEKGELTTKIVEMDSVVMTEPFARAMVQNLAALLSANQE